MQHATHFHEFLGANMEVPQEPVTLSDVLASVPPPVPLDDEPEPGAGADAGAGAAARGLVTAVAF